MNLKLQLFNKITAQNYKNNLQMYSEFETTIIPITTSGCLTTKSNQQDHYKMSQEQPRRSEEAVKYGDISGQLASQPIAPQDAAALQLIKTRRFLN